MARDNLRRVLVLLSFSVIAGFTFAFLMEYRSTGTLHWELFVHAFVISVVLWVVGHAPTERPTGRCPVCGSRVFPTRRASDAARLWTCSGCAFEVPRTWVRPGRAPKPPSAAGPNQPGPV